MKQSIYQTKKKELLKKKALKLYREGLTLREVGKIIGKSYQWVANAMKDLTRLDRRGKIKGMGRTQNPRKVEKNNQLK